MSPRGAPKEAKGGKASNESAVKERRCEQRRSGAAGVGVSAKGSVVPERKAVRWGVRFVAMPDERCEKTVFHSSPYRFIEIFRFRRSPPPPL